MLNLRGIKARPGDLEVMMAHKPTLVELHCSVGDLDWTPERRYNVPLAVHVPEYFEGELLDPASPNEAKRLRAEEVYRRAAGSAARWAPFFQGTPKVVYHPGGMTPSEGDGERDTSPVTLWISLGKTTDAMLAEAGAAADVLIENLPAFGWFNAGNWRSQFMTSGREIAAFCAKKKIGATLDLCHLHLTDHDKLAEIRALLPHVRHVHYSDGRMREGAAIVSKEGLQVGEGDTPLATYFSELLSLREQRTIVAVPEIWYGHEHGGAAFVTAWERAEALMQGRKEVAAHG